MKIHPQQLTLLSPQYCNNSNPSSCIFSPPNNNYNNNNNNNININENNDKSFSKEVFTLWMKSLILGGKGCTVFDSSGRVAYRVDNYGSKCCTKVFLMDSHGNVLLTIHRKKFRLLPCWEGYREEKKKGSSWLFQVQKCWKITKKPLELEVVVSLDHDKKSQVFKIEKGKTDFSSCRVVDKFGGPIAEMKRKQSKGGVVLGDDVMTLMVEPNVNHSLIMGLVLSYSLIYSRI